MVDMIAQLAAELDGHTVTDEQGNMTESETVNVEAAPVESTTEDEPTQVETPAEPPKPAPQAEDDDEEIPVEDESGKRYVPEKRFKDVYAKSKAMERELAAYRQQMEQGQALLNTPKGKKVEATNIPVDKADVLELKMTYPQFNPNSDQYDPDLDDEGYTIWKANGGQLSIIQAAKQAMDKHQRLQQKIMKQVTGVKQEARLVKSVQSDQGITHRVISRNQEVDIDKMDDKQLEAHLKATGQW